jgi:hypothetical protein
MPRNDDGPSKSVLTAFHRVPIDLENAHRLRVFIATLEVRDLRTKLSKIFWHGESDDAILMAFTTASWLSKRDNHGVLLTTSRKDPKVDFHL